MKYLLQTERKQQLSFLFRAQNVFGKEQEKTLARTQERAGEANKITSLIMWSVPLTNRLLILAL